MSGDTNGLASVEFEVFGDVQALKMETLKKEGTIDIYQYFSSKNEYYVVLTVFKPKIFDVRHNGTITEPQLALFLQIGCFFTKYCKEMAEELDIGGWVKNTKNGTIVGRIQGAKTNLDKMIEWLSTKGSPDCKISKCELTNFEYVARLAFNNFSIRF